jgi:hypothetical protein
MARRFDKKTQQWVVTPDEADRVPLENETHARVVMAEPQYKMSEAAHKQPHGLCRHFRHRDGQDQAASEQFFQRLFREEKFDPSWFGNPALYGLCDVFEGRLLDATNPGQCKLREALCHPRYEHPEEVRWADYDTMVPCPYFEDRSTKGEKIVTTRMGVGRK